jgi:Putative zinc-finger
MPDKTLADRACAKAARMISAAQDRPLTLGERLTLRIHLALCEGCTNYERQVQFLREAMGRWARYSDAAGEEAGTP